MPKMTLKTIDTNRVVLSYDCGFTGERKSREFYVTRGGGYVREEPHGKQVCVELDRLGTALTANEPHGDDLETVIRREYRAMRRAEKRC